MFEKNYIIVPKKEGYMGIFNGKGALDIWDEESKKEQTEELKNQLSDKEMLIVA